MKKGLLIIALLCVTIITNAQDVKWYTDFNKASEIAMKEKKPLMLFFTGSDWCGWCKVLKKEVLDTKEFATWANKEVIAVELDFPRFKQLDPATAAVNNQLGSIMGIQGYPTVCFAEPTITADKNLNLAVYGKQGYLKGGPAAWLQAVTPFLPAAKAVAAPTKKG